MLYEFDCVWGVVGGVHLHVRCMYRRKAPSLWDLGKLASTLKLCSCDLYAQNYYCFWGPHKNKVVFFLSLISASYYVQRSCTEPMPNLDPPILLQ